MHRALKAFQEPGEQIAVAVLVQTLQDVRGVKCTRREQREARTFLYSEMFEGLCDGLGLDPFRVRGHMQT